MSECSSCGTKLGLLTPSRELDGQKYCLVCFKKALDGRVINQLRTRAVCMFQEPRIANKQSFGYDCVITGFGSYATNHGPKECNPDMCPMYQTWNLLKKGREPSLKQA
jgi:hypothetical protein